MTIQWIMGWPERASYDVNSTKLPGSFFSTLAPYVQVHSTVVGHLFSKSYGR